MIHYHVWFEPKPGVAEATVLAFARAFIAELTQQQKLARGLLLRNTGTAPKSRLMPYHALFEFSDDAQMERAFGDKRREGIHVGPHGGLIDSVAQIHVEVFRAV